VRSAAAVVKRVAALWLAARSLRADFRRGRAWQGWKIWWLCRDLWILEEAHRFLPPAAIWQAPSQS